MPRLGDYEGFGKGVKTGCNAQKPCYDEAGSTTEQWVRNTVDSSFGSALPRQHGCPPPFGPVVSLLHTSLSLASIRAGDFRSSGPRAVFDFPQPKRNAHAQY